MAQELHQQTPAIAPVDGLTAASPEIPRVFMLNKGSVLWAGVSLESIRTKYLDMFGVEPDLKDPRELTEAEMLASRISYHDNDDLYHEQPKERNFREHLDAMIANREPFPWFFFGSVTHPHPQPSAQTATICIWKLNDYEWWAGASLDEIRADYERETGVDPDSPEGFEGPHELSDDEMLRFRYHFDEFDNSKTRTFREELDRRIAAGQTFPCFFTGTES